MTEARILVVDDQPLVAQTCADILDGEGYQVQAAFGGQEALDRLEKEQFDLLLADLKMPGVDGLAVLHRARELHPGLAAIMMTSYATLEHAIEALRAGAQDFLLKPFNPDEMLQVVGNALAARRREQAAWEERVARQQITAILERVGDGFVAFDTQMNYTYVNARGGELLGREPEDLVGKNYWDEYPEAKGTPFAEAYRRALETQTPILFEDHYAPWDRWFENRIYPSPLGLSVFFTEITARKRSEEALREKSEELDRYFENSLDLLCIADTDGYFRRLNREWERTLGYPLSELGGKQFLEFVHPDDVQVTQAAVARLASQQKVVGFVNRYRCQDGTYRWIEWRSYPEGQTIFAVARDITGRVQAEERYRRLFEEAPVMYVITRNQDGQPFVTDCNRSFLQTLGYTRAEAVGRLLTDFYSPASRAIALKDGGYQRALAGRFEAEERQLLTRTGEVVETLAQAVPETGVDGAVIGTRVTFVDITERKQAEEKLRAAHELSQKVFRSSPIPSVLTRLPERTVIDANPAFATTLGYSRDEAIGRPISDLDLWADSAERQRVAQVLLERGEVLDHEFVYRTKSGSTGHAVFNAEVFDLGADRYVLAKIVDITKRKQAEEALRQSEAHLEEAQRIAHIGSWDWIAATDTPTWSRELCTILEVDPDKPVPSMAEQDKLYTPDSMARMRAAVERTMQTGEPYEIELERVREDGSRRWLLARGERWYGEGGQLIGLRGTALDITGRKQAEEALSVSEERFYKAFHASPDVIVLTSLADGRLVEVNESLERTTGYTQADILGKTTAELQFWADPAQRDRYAEMLRRDGRVRDLEVGFRIKSGEIRDTLLSGEIIQLQDGPHILGVIRDITERKRAEQALRRNEHVLRLFVEHSPAALAMFDRDMKYIVASHRYLKDHNLGEQHLVGRSHYEVFPEIPERWREIHRRCLAGAIEQCDRDPFPRADGRLDWVRWEIHPWYEAGGEIGGIILFSEVITERVQAREEIRRRATQQEALNTIIAAAAAALDLPGLLEIALDCTLNALELAQGAIWVGTQRVVRGALTEAGPLVSEVAQVGGMDMPGPQPVEDWQQVPDDNPLSPLRWVMAHLGVRASLAVPFLVTGERVGGLSVVSAGPRGWTAAEIALVEAVGRQLGGVAQRLRLEETRRRLSTAVEQATDGVIITDTEDTILYVNPAFERISGYSRAEALGQSSKILQSGKHDEAFYRELWETIGAGRAWKGRFINRKKDGSLYTEDATVTPVRNQAGEIVNYVSVKRDVTRELQLEQQLHQAQKMEAIGRLAGGVAHDFNNLLTVIHLSTRLLEQQLHHQDPLWDHVQRIQEAGQRATALTKQLLAFSRQEVVQPRLLDLNVVIEDLSKMLQRMIGEDVELRTALAADLWPAYLDPTQVEQVIMNLAVNARDAMPQGGMLAIETANMRLDDAYSARHLGVEAGEYLQLSVSDTGMGMSEDVQARIFEPFFTTKERGTGLGLATVYGIVQQNQGHVWVYSEVGKGTTFKVYLPRAREVEAQRRERLAAPNGEPAAPLRSTETILLVEDDDGIRDLASDILATYGYHVLTARDGMEALQIGERHPGPIHLLVTDVVMPAMSGRELADRLRGQRPQVHVLFTSGYTDETISRHGVLAEGVAFLPKPFTLESLTEKVRAVLDAAP